MFGIKNSIKAKNIPYTTQFASKIYKPGFMRFFHGFPGHIPAVITKQLIIQFKPNISYFQFSTLVDTLKNYVLNAI